LKCGLEVLCGLLNLLGRGLGATAPGHPEAAANDDEAYTGDDDFLGHDVTLKMSLNAALATKTAIAE